MVTPNPFASTIYEGDPRRTPAENAPIYLPEHARVAAAIHAATSAEPGAPGALLMIRGAAAGAGKSHLLASAVSSVVEQTRALPIVFNRETPPTWVELFRQSLILLAEPGESGAPSALSDTARQLLAELVGELIAKGVVPSENPGRARLGLEQDYARLLDLRGDSPIAQWFVENSEQLLDPLATGLQKRTRMGYGVCRDWLSFLVQFETGDGEVPVPESFASGEGQAKASMRHLGQLVSRYRPLLLVFDQLDAFYRDADSALSAGYLFSELARIGVAPLTLISANEDLWSESFATALPGALSDRLTELCVVLGGIGPDAARSLLDARLKSARASTEAAERFYSALDLDGLFAGRHDAPIMPRELLRIAGGTWLTGTRASEPETEIPGAAPARETLGRVQAMLRNFNQRKPAAEEEAPAPDAVPEHVVPSPWESPAEDAPAALRKFASERDSIYFSSDLVFDPSAIRHTLELAGRRSPLLEYSEFDVTGETDAASWRSPDHEILFGFEPAERTPYWRALVEQAGESPLGRAKVVAFTPPGTPGFATEGLNGHGQKRLDILELDRCALATIAAADRVVSSSSNEEETFAQLAPELDSLWRRITRPMGA